MTEREKINGHQLRAARNLIGLEQIELAERAGVAVNTIRRMEAFGAAPITGQAAKLDRVVETLRKLGVEFVNGGHPGVRLIGRRKK